MNEICKTCDTKNRLGLCEGKNGNFKYCFRKAGSTDGLEKTITPFTTMEDLYLSCEWINTCFEQGSLKFDDYYYTNDKHMLLLYGKYFGDSKEYPIGFVTV